MPINRATQRNNAVERPHVRPPDGCSSPDPTLLTPGAALVRARHRRIRGRRRVRGAPAPRGRSASRARAPRFFGSSRISYLHRGTIRTVPRAVNERGTRGRRCCRLAQRRWRAGPDVRRDGGFELKLVHGIRNAKFPRNLRAGRFPRLARV